MANEFFASVLQEVQKKLDYQHLLERIDDLEDLVSILEAKLKAKPENYEEWDIVSKKIA